jgi:hypothetical protein
MTTGKERENIENCSTKIKFFADVFPPLPADFSATQTQRREESAEKKE